MAKYQVEKVQEQKSGAMGDTCDKVAHASAEVTLMNRADKNGASTQEEQGSTELSTPGATCSVPCSDGNTDNTAEDAENKARDSQREKWVGEFVGSTAEWPAFDGCIAGASIHVCGQKDYMFPLSQRGVDLYRG